MEVSLEKKLVDLDRQVDFPERLVVYRLVLKLERRSIVGCGMAGLVGWVEVDSRLLLEISF